MIELILSTCLIADPNNCQETRLVFSGENLTPYQCLMQAPPQMAKWVGEHPQYKITKWSCARAGRFAKS